MCSRTVRPGAFSDSSRQCTATPHAVTASRETGTAAVAPGSPRRGPTPIRRRLANPHLNHVGPNSRFSITHDFLAYLLGASRQTVTTLMNEFAKKGYIESDRGSITVPDRTRLERAACERYSVIK